MSLLEFSMHPGEVLQELYMKPLGLSSIKLADAIGVPRSRVERVVKGTAGISPDTARRLARVFRTSPELWLNMQVAYDLHVSREEQEIEELEPLVPEFEPAAA